MHDRETHLSQSQLTKLSPMNVELKLAMKLIIMEVANDWETESGKGEKQKETKVTKERRMS